MLASAGILIKFGTIASFIFLSIFCENGLSYKIGVFKWKKQKTKNKKKTKKTNKQTNKNYSNNKTKTKNKSEKPQAFIWAESGHCKVDVQ